jgi:CHAD domain-containing protein
MSRAAAPAQRVLRGHLRTLEQILAKRGHDADDIHDIRVLTKKLRAWLKFVDPDRRDKRIRKADRALRRLAKSLGAARDQQVLLETLAKLEPYCVCDAEKQACRQVSATLDGIPPIAAKPPILCLTPAIRALRNHAGSALDANEIRRRLNARYGALRHSGANALKAGQPPEQLHAFRKRAKALQHQLDYLPQGGLPHQERTRKHLSRLGDELGVIHDVDVLSATLETPAKEWNVEPNLMQDIGTVIKRARADRLGRARHLHGKAFRKRGR